VLAVRESVAIERVSSVWLTEPVGLRAQPPFYNAVLSGRTEMEPQALLAALIAIERGMGRRRDALTVPMGPRTIDLDLLVYDALTVEEPGLVLPHPRMKTRRFVLAPLAEIAPELRLSPDSRPVAEIFEGLPHDDAVERLQITGWPPPLDSPFVR
jgi:2-amino-4-hydroxy-6-hydroxymethyldihydropteridine diphosphokinase